MEHDDERLVAACRQGDNAAWECLIQRYQRLVYAIPRRAGLDDEAAAEVFQHVFTVLVEHLDRFEQPDRLRAWLVTTARRETWRLCQQRRPTLVGGSSGPTEVSDDTLLTVADPGRLPDEEVLLLEEQHLVRQALAALDGRSRRLLTLLYYTTPAPSYAEIAAELGTTVGSIGPTRARCLDKLRQQLMTLGF